MVTRLLKRVAMYILKEELKAARRNYMALDNKYCESCQNHYIAEQKYQVLLNRVRQATK